MADIPTIDDSNVLAGANQVISFHHELSGLSVHFKAFDISYSESITNDWEEVVLPRRINRSYTWTNVIRSISLGWNIPAFDINEAKQNLSNCSNLVKMMYPMTDGDGYISGGNPIWHLGIMNWAHNPASANAGTGEDKSTMLAGFPSSFNFDIVGTDGYIYDGHDPYPKNIKCSMGYTVLLDDDLNFSWSSSGVWNGPGPFPWAADEG